MLCRPDPKDEYLESPQGYDYRSSDMQATRTMLFCFLTLLATPCLGLVIHPAVRLIIPCTWMYPEVSLRYLFNSQLL
jgi:hypothetical protein